MTSQPDAPLEEVRGRLSARRLAQAPHRSCVIHADDGWVQPVRDGKFDFFTRLAPLLANAGISARIVSAGSPASQVTLAQDHLHIMVGTEPRYGPGILHAMPAYIWGFWYFDELGAYAHSSLRMAGFAPDQIDAEKATYFFNGVTGYMLRENVSRQPQEVRMSQPMARAAATIFCQEIEQEPERLHYVTTEQMIRTTAERDREALVYVKLHPAQSKPVRRHLMAICADYQNVRVSEASVHDLIEASDVVVTQNSGAGFEALMQRKCVITCAKSDYWHATLTPRTDDELRDALAYGQQAMDGFAYEKYFYWFLDRRCLEPAKAEFPARAWARIREKCLL